MNGNQHRSNVILSTTNILALSLAVTMCKESSLPLWSFYYGTVTAPSALTQYVTAHNFPVNFPNFSKLYNVVHCMLYPSVTVNK